MFAISHLSVWLIAMPFAAIAFAVIYLIFGPMRYRQLIRTVRNQGERTDTQIPCDAEGEPLKISVVAYSAGHTDEVERFLRAMAEQDYPSIEIIIVVDGNARQASVLEETFTDAFPNASFSFVPHEALNLSRRKLANTIGIKKASGEIIVTTLTNIHIPSPQWLSYMASPFATPQVEIVLGAAFMDFRAMKGMKQWYRRFDSLMTAARWMIYAIDGRPYRGDGANLAFRRDLFFRNSGYGNNYYLHAGDDDIFVSQVSTAANSRFMFAPQATLRVDWGASSRRMWISNKERYTFSQRFLKHRPGIGSALLNCANWTATILSGATIALALPANLSLPLTAMCVLLIIWGCEIFLYRRLAAVMHSLRLWWSIPLFYLLKPVADALFSIRYRRRRNQNFTWRR